MFSTYNKALECLARGPKSVKDLTRWLLQRDFPKDEVDATIERLIARNLLNDRPGTASILIADVLRQLDAIDAARQDTARMG